METNDIDALALRHPSIRAAMAAANKAAMTEGEAATAHHRASIAYRAAHARVLFAIAHAVEIEAAR